MTNHDSGTAQASSLSAEIDEALAWCSYSNGHKTARLLVRLRGKLAEAWDEGFEAGATWSPSGPSGVPHDPPSNPHKAAKLVDD